MIMLIYTHRKTYVLHRKHLCTNEKYLYTLYNAIYLQFPKLLLLCMVSCLLNFKYSCCFHQLVLVNILMTIKLDTQFNIF